MLFCYRLIVCWKGSEFFIEGSIELLLSRYWQKCTNRLFRRIVGDWAFDFFNGCPFFGESSDLLRRHEDKEVSMSRVFSTFGFGFDFLTSKSIPFAPKSFDCDGFKRIGLARKIFTTAQSSKNEKIKRIPVTHPDTKIQFESDDLKRLFKGEFRMIKNIFEFQFFNKTDYNFHYNH